MIPPCLTLSNIRYISRIKWDNPAKGVAIEKGAFWSSSTMVTNFTYLLPSFGYTKLFFKKYVRRGKIKFDWDTMCSFELKGLKEYWRRMDFGRKKLNKKKEAPQNLNKQIWLMRFKYTHYTKQGFQSSIFAVSLTTSLSPPLSLSLSFLPAVFLYLCPTLHTALNVGGKNCFLIGSSPVTLYSLATSLLIISRLTIFSISRPTNSRLTRESLSLFISIYFIRLFIYLFIYLITCCLYPVNRLRICNLEISAFSMLYLD